MESRNKFTSATPRRSLLSAILAWICFFACAALPQGSRASCLSDCDGNWKAALASRLATEIHIPELRESDLFVSTTPACPIEELHLRTIRTSIFGDQLLTLQCASSVNTIPFTVRLKGTPLKQNANVHSSAEARRPTFLVRRGSRVQVGINLPAMRITTSATALTDGALGDSVKVRVLKTRRTLVARVTGSGSVAAEPYGSVQ